MERFPFINFQIDSSLVYLYQKVSRQKTLINNLQKCGDN
jgi:hypothetical protein